MRSYKLLEISTQYGSYLSYFYRKHPEYVDLTYNELKQLFFDDSFAEAGHIHPHLGELGIESAVIFYNNRNLQDKSKFKKENQSYFELLLKQIQDYNPDVIYNNDVSFFTKSETQDIISCTGRKIHLVGYDFCLPHGSRFLENVELYSQIYTGSNDFVDEYRKKGINSLLLRHAFEPSILNRIHHCSPEMKVSFCGSIVMHQHYTRLDMIDVVLKNRIPLNCYIDISGVNDLIYDRINDSRAGKKYMNILSDLIGHVKPSLYGLEYYEALQSCLIVLNMHSHLIKNGVGNVRMFESTGVGACLLTDRRDGNKDIFEEDKEIVAYSSYDEMIDKIKWLLDSPDKAKEIAKAGQKRTLENYTYRNKAIMLNEYIQELLN